MARILDWGALSPPRVRQFGRTRPVASWRLRPRDRELFGENGNFGEGAEMSTRGRVRSPANPTPIRV